MRGPDRRTRWRKAVYAPRDGMTHGCRVLLLRLADDMNHKGIVSIPRTRLVDELGCHPARITEWVTLAKKLGFLDTVRRGRPHVTAVYQATIPPSRGTADVPLEVRNPYLNDDDLEVRKPGDDEVLNPYLSEASRGTESGYPSSSTQVEHSSVPPVVVESATRSAATKSTDDEPEAEVTAPRRAWEDSA